MDKNTSDPVHFWLIWAKAFQAASKYLYAGIEETGLGDSDFRILEALLNKGPLPVTWRKILAPALLAKEKR